ncbi:two-component system chemotaxis response regulator CheY [Kineothrix alysoides]|uniref:Stage 0 sporulation protein A homolog n=1 Tax=Kineothrix alysoides TaxID=1469948 RepID=A0A4R1QVD0_9FIRM|nr:response regulator [Kineothrix alysoides]TCL56535.1 two-component system chemotaxis response regulator CheY [Kineothrix alysoides]
MKILLAEDDFASRKFMYKYLSRYGDCDITVNGIEALEAFQMGLAEGDPYQLICLDVMMPEMDGYQALYEIRKIEMEKGIKEDKAVKIIMTTALNEEKNVKKAFDLNCTAYSGKPIDTEKFALLLKKIGLIT